MQLCQTKVHLKCNYLSYVDSQYIKISNKTWHCYNCSRNLFSFATNNFMHYPLVSDRNYCDKDSTDSCLALKPKNYLKRICLVNFNSKYYDINQLSNLKAFPDKSSLSHFQHLLTSSLFKQRDHLIQSTMTDFDIIAFSESTLIKVKLPPTDVSFTSYSL